MSNNESLSRIVEHCVAHAAVHSAIPAQTDNCCREGKNQVVLKAAASLITGHRCIGMHFICRCYACRSFCGMWVSADRCEV